MQGVGCEVWMVLVVCMKLDGVRWAGSSEYTACSTRFDKVFRVCVNIAHQPHRGRCVMSTTSIVHTSDCLYMYILYTQERTKREKLHIIYHISYIISYNIYLSSVAVYQVSLLPSPHSYMTRM